MNWTLPEDGRDMTLRMDRGWKKDRRRIDGEWTEDDSYGENCSKGEFAFGSLGCWGRQTSRVIMVVTLTTAANPGIGRAVCVPRDHPH